MGIKELEYIFSRAIDGRESNPYKDILNALFKEIEGGGIKESSTLTIKQLYKALGKSSAKWDIAIEKYLND